MEETKTELKRKNIRKVFRPRNMRRLMLKINELIEVVNELKNKQNG